MGGGGVSVMKGFGCGGCGGMAGEFCHIESPSDVMSKPWRVHKLSICMFRSVLIE